MKRLISLIFTAVLFLSALVSYICVMNGAKELPYFGKGYTVLRLFDSNGFNPSEISTIRYAAESASEADVEDDGRLWCDGYSYFTQVHVARDGKSGIECNAVVTGGDYFLFHNLNFKSGWYYTDTDLHLDRVIIDEKLAFELFGSNDIEDMSLNLGSRTLYVAGVVEYDESKAKQDQLGEKPMIYIPQHIAEELFGERDFENYEIMMQNPVSSYAVNALTDAAADKTIIDVTHRYRLGRIFEILKSFPTRSYRSEAVVYPYWENADRGTEDILALLMVLNAVTLAIFVTNITLFIFERKKS